MKSPTKSLHWAAMLAWCVVAAAEDSGERTTASFTDPSRPGLVHVGLIQGTITVKGTDRKDVIIEPRSSRVGALSRGPENPTRMRRLPQQPSITVEEQDNQMSIGSPNVNRTVDLQIEVPKRTNLQLSTVNDGDIRVEGVDGELEIGSVNGAITLSDVGGAVVAHTVNGKVAATVSRVSLEKPMAFTSLNGAVDVTLPASTRANLKLRSDNGTVNTDFQLSTLTQPSAAIEDTHRAGGRYRVEVSKAIYGSLNGGGPEIELRTFNGNVYVRKGH
jgi:Putative adhesin